jgi:PAS domain S-box-containing protein
MRNDKTKEQLIADVTALRRRVAELEDAADQHEETRDALRRRNRELSLFNRVGRTLSSTLDLEAVLATLLEEVRSLLGIVASSVWLVEPETGALVCKHATGPRNEEVRGWRLPPGEGFVGLVARTGESLIVPDTKNDPRYFSEVAEEADLVLRSILTIPLHIGDRVVGVLQAVDTEVDRFDASDLALLRPLAASAAIAVENAWLYQEAQQEIAERKRAESEREAALDALQESEVQFDLFMRHLPAAVSITDVEGRVIYANDGFARAADCKREALIGHTTEARLPPALHARYRAENQRVLEGETIISETTLLIREATTHWITYKFPLFRKGKPSYVAWVSLDISERKRAEARVIREAERAAALLRIADRLNSYLTLEELLGAICEETGRALDLPGAMVFMHNPARGLFALAQSSGVSAAVEAAFRSPPDDVCHRLNHDDRVLIPDFRDDPALADHELTVRYGIRTLVGMRIVYEEELLGCLMVHTVGEPRTFGVDDLALLRGIADHAAQAIVTARLFSEQRRSRRRMEALSQRLVEAQEVERRYLARELHDDIGQVLTSIKLNLQAIRGDGMGSKSQEALGMSLEAVDRAIQRVRTLSRDLRPSVLDDLGLVPALRSLVDRDAQHAPFAASFAADPLETRLPAPLESAYFRIAQEALTNAMRHADAARVFVELRLREGDLVLIVRDDGRGFEVEGAVDEAGAGQSLGLVSMQERAHLIGGTFEVRSEPGSGTEIRVRTPIDAPDLHGVDDHVPNWIPQ